ncbi:3'-5' exonuclease [Pseudomonas sp. HK3]
MTIEQQKYSTQEIARNLLDNNPFYLDTETTGFSVQDEVIELALYEMDEYHNSGSINLFRFNPTVDSSPDALKVHRLPKSILKNYNRFSDNDHRLLNALVGERAVIAFNANFDERMLFQTCSRYGLPFFEWHWFDLMGLANRHFMKDWGKWCTENNQFKRMSLNDICSICNVEQIAAHTAYDDAKVCYDILKFIAEDE